MGKAEAFSGESFSGEPLTDLKAGAPPPELLESPSFFSEVQPSSWTPPELSESPLLFLGMEPPFC